MDTALKAHQHIAVKSLIPGVHAMQLSHGSMEGLLCVNILDERVSANADTFVNFLEIHLLPALQPFNGINSRSVVVMGK